MYLRNLAPGVDLLVTNLTQYRAWNHRASFLNGQLLQINLETPSPDTTIESNEVELLFSLVDAETGAPAVLPEFQVTFFDLDQGDAAGNGQECVSIPAGNESSGITEVAYVPHPEHRTITLAPDRRRDGWLRACSQLAGLGADNPADPMALTDAPHDHLMN